MKNYNWEYFEAQTNKRFQNQKLSTVKEKLLWSVFGFMKAILGFTRMSVRGINKFKKN